MSVLKSKTSLKKAPKVKAPKKSKPNFMKEADDSNKRRSAQFPLTKKRLSK